MMTRRQEIKTIALEMLKSHPSGMRYSELVRRIHERCPHIPINTIHGNIWNLEARCPDEVCKPAKGVFHHAAFEGQDVTRCQAAPSSYTLVTHEFGMRLNAIPREEMQLKEPKPYTCLTRFENDLRKRSAYKRYLGETVFFYSMFDVG